MTTEQVKTILIKHHDREAVCVALSYVNLSDKELETLIYRYMRRLTQEETEKIFDVSTNTVFNWQQSALRKTAKMWSRLPLAQILWQTIK